MKKVNIRKDELYPVYYEDEVNEDEEYDGFVPAVLWGKYDAALLRFMKVRNEVSAYLEKQKNKTCK